MTGGKGDGINARYPFGIRITLPASLEWKDSLFMFETSCFINILQSEIHFVKYTTFLTMYIEIYASILSGLALVMKFLMRKIKLPYGT